MGHLAECALQRAVRKCAKTSTPGHGRRGLALVALLLVGMGGVSPAAGQVTPRERPAGVTDSAIAWGKALFQGSANCARCHGRDGRGSAFGPDLADAIWWHGPGSYEWLVREVTHGIPDNLTVTGDPMPARGSARMNELDTRAVAAYVWALSHPPKPPLPEPYRAQ